MFFSKECNVQKLSGLQGLREGSAVFGLRCQPGDHASVLLKGFAVVVLTCVLDILMLVFDKYCFMEQCYNIIY